MIVAGQPGTLLSETHAAELQVPEEIAFLRRAGFSAQDLGWAGHMAARAGVLPDAWMLKGGYVDEDRFYRALAAETGLPFLEEPQLGSGTAFPRSIDSAVAPLAGGGWAVAPEGTQLRRLIELGRERPEGLAIATPTAFRGAVLAACGASIAHGAAEELRSRRPDEAFPRHDLFRALACVGAALIGLGAAAALAPETAVQAVSLTIASAFLTMVLLRVFSVAHPAPVAAQPAVRLHDSVLPVYTVIVALYREAPVLPQLIAALRRLDYPPAKLDIKLVIEQDDTETSRALEAVALPAFVQVIVAPPGLPRTKPRALNVALPLARGAYTVVYDAEDEPDPGQLRLAVARFRALAAPVACLQARLAVRDWNGLLGRLFAVEYAALFDVINPALVAARVPLPLGGTSNHFRTSVLRELAGWDAWNVTEDADLGIRLARAGYAVEDLPSSTFEEAPPNLGQWLRQRARWMKGFMQTCITHSRRPVTTARQLGPQGTFGAFTMTYGTVVSALGYPFFTAAFLVSLATGTLFAIDGPLGLAWSLTAIVLFAAGVAAMILPALVGIVRRRWWGLLPCLPLLPFYYVLISLGAWCGLAELVLNTYRWNKTEHGLSRRPRAAAEALRPPVPAGG